MNAKNNAYTIVSLVFFITYTIFQAPATILIRKIGPRLFLSAIVLFWGATMIVSHRIPSIDSSLNRWIRASVLCQTGQSWLAYELFLVVLRLDFIPDVSTC